MLLNFILNKLTSQEKVFVSKLIAMPPNKPKVGQPGVAKGSEIMTHRLYNLHLSSPNTIIISHFKIIVISQNSTKTLLPLYSPRSKL